MTQSKFENLSALLDGEQLDGEQSVTGLIDEIGKDEELMARWQRYHLARDGMRNELPQNLQFDIADAVADALEKEPVIVASPAESPAITTFPEAKENKVVSLWQKNIVPLFRQGGQFAIAASVAMAVIIGYQQINYSQPEADLNIAPVKAVSGIQSGFSPVSLSHDTTTSQSDMIEKRRKLNALMADHQQQMMLKTSVDEEQQQDKSEDKQN